MSVFLAIEDKLMAAFEPQHLEVINESHMHGSGRANPGAESHFKVVLVSQKFHGQRLLQRHRAVHKVLAEELQHKIHALALHTYTQTEWHDLFGDVPLSPPCLGGSKRTPKAPKNSVSSR